MTIPLAEISFCIEYKHVKCVCVGVMTMRVGEHIRAIITWERYTRTTTIKVMTFSSLFDLETGFHFLNEFQAQANGTGSKEIKGDMIVLGSKHISIVHEVFKEKGYDVEDIGKSKLRVLKNLNN